MTTLSHVAPAASGTLTLPWVPLVSRTALFALAQVLIAAGLALTGDATPWATSAGWWPLSGTLANLVCIALLWRVIRAEGTTVADFIHVRRDGLAGDLGRTALFLLAAAALTTVPTVGLGALLFEDPQAPVAMFIRPVPRWAALLGLVAFPLTIALAELPTYFVWARQALVRAGASSTSAWLVPALFLAAQHITLPLVLDGRFIAWRLLMFLPFALLVGFMVARRPRLLPWLMVCHGLLDLAAAGQVVAARR